VPGLVLELGLGQVPEPVLARVLEPEPVRELERVLEPGLGRVPHSPQ
jgi:hypothetical protein